MQFYRVKQISENQYIPQVKFWFLGYWYGICSSFWTYFSKVYQEECCAKETLDDAVKVIDGYKNIYFTKKQYPKYHKL